MLLCIEGSDGSGKSSVADALAKRLKGDVLSFPNDSGMTGPLIRQYLRKQWWLSGSTDIFDEAADCRHAEAMAFQALQVTNRLGVMPRLMDAALGHAKTPIVLARYWQSGWVYGQLDGLDPNWLTDIHKTMARPNLNILLDLDPDEAMRRRAARDGPLSAERYEGKRELAVKIAELYRQLWQKQTIGWAVVDANQPFDAVCTACWKLLSSDPWCTSRG